MIGKSKSHLKRVCRNYMEVENYDAAMNSNERWHLHHRMEIQPDGVLLSTKWMKDHNIYYDLDPCMLIFLSEKDHLKLHRDGKKLTEDTKRKISNSRVGKFTGEKSPNFGKFGKLNPNWKGTDCASGRKLYMRLYMRARNASRIAKEEV